MRPLAPLLCATALVVTGCSAGDAPTDAPDVAATPAETDGTTGLGDEDIAGNEGTTDDPSEAPQVVPGGGESPAPGECIAVPEAADGIYAVADAGVATVAVEDGGLVVGTVEAADGWEHEVTEDEGREVEIEFRGDTEIDLELELEDGTVRVELCADDD